MSGVKLRPGAVEIKLTKRQLRQLEPLEEAAVEAAHKSLLKLGAIFGQFDPFTGTFRARFFQHAPARKLQKIIVEAAK